MDRLRPRNRPVFFGFTNAEIEKMEKVLQDSGEESPDKEFCQRLTKSFNRSSGRAGKPVIKWTEIQSWFQTRLQGSPEVAKIELTRTKGLESKEGGIRDPLELEFEARSLKDGAWYDVEKFIAHRLLSTGEAERRDQAIYYDAHILEIQRKMHDIRGCRCLFLIRYAHDNSEDKVRLRRLCRRPKSKV